MRGTTCVLVVVVSDMVVNTMQDILLKNSKVDQLNIRNITTPFRVDENSGHLHFSDQFTNEKDVRMVIFPNYTVPGQASFTADYQYLLHILSH